MVIPPDGGEDDGCGCSSFIFLEESDAYDAPEYCNPDLEITRTILFFRKYFLIWKLRVIVIIYGAIQNTFG
jgi:hypothetical protein